MAQSTGIIVSAGAITFTNEFIHHQINWKVPIATAGAALIFAGMEKIPGAAPFAVGIAVIALIGVLIGGVSPNVPSPAVQILNFIQGKG